MRLASSAILIVFSMIILISCGSPEEMNKSGLYYDRLQKRVYEIHFPLADPPDIRVVWHGEESLSEADAAAGAGEELFVKWGDTLLLVQDHPRMREVLGAEYMTTLLALKPTDQRFDGLFSAELPLAPPLRQDEVLELMPKVTAVFGFVVHNVWMRVPDSRYLHVLDAVEENDFAAAEADLHLLRTEHPDNLLLLLSGLDITIVTRNPDRFLDHLQELKQMAAESEDPFLEGTIDWYELWLIAYNAEAEGNNLHKKIESLFNRDNAFDWEQARRIYLNSDFDDVLMALDRRLVLPPANYFQVPNFLNYQLIAKIFQISAVSRLFHGEATAAWQETLASHRVGVIMMRDANSLIERLIGIAIAGLSSTGMQYVLFDGMTRPDQINQSWGELETALQQHRAAANSPALRQGLDLDERLFPSRRDINTAEARMRNLFVLTRIELLRAGAAARHAYLLNGRYPADDEHFAPPLLPALEADPFSHSGRSLRYRGDGDQGAMLYSVGPDGDDDVALIPYDPTNGTISDGDVFLQLPYERKYPFPPQGLDAQTHGELNHTFPNGLPSDPFSRLESFQHIGEPLTIYSVGPDTSIDAGPQLAPDGGLLIYDPTNGVVSPGEIILYRRPY